MECSIRTRVILAFSLALNFVLLACVVNHKMIQSGVAQVEEWLGVHASPASEEFVNRSMFDDAFAMTMESPGSGQGYYALGLMYLQSGTSERKDDSLALAYLTKAVSLQPDNYQARFAIATIHLKHSERAEACSEAKKGLDFVPTADAHWESLYRSLLRQCN